ncbi:MAG: YdeI/OmpD-associated family protein [Ginsengibacter sp.]
MEKAMNKETLIVAEGVVHEVPEDLKKALVKDSLVLEKWNNLTPLARNEWICWTTIVKKAETRKEHIDRLCAELLEGKRRPCCWPGCPHRRPNAKKWFK